LRMGNGSCALGRALGIGPDYATMMTGHASRKVS
jgi:hypothetical protein